MWLGIFLIYILRPGAMSSSKREKRDEVWKPRRGSRSRSRSRSDHHGAAQGHGGVRRCRCTCDDPSSFISGLDVGGLPTQRCQCLECGPVDKEGRRQGCQVQVVFPFPRCGDCRQHGGIRQMFADMEDELRRQRIRAALVILRNARRGSSPTRPRE